MKRFLIAFLLISFAGLFVFGAYVTHGQHTGVSSDCMATMLNGTRCADAEDHADILSAVSKTMLTQPFPSILFGLLALLVVFWMAVSVSVSPAALGNIRREYRQEYAPPPNLQMIARWLSRHINSPSPA